MSLFTLPNVNPNLYAFPSAVKKKDILKNGVEYERINNPFECKVLAKGKNASRGDISVKMPVCGFTILNP